MDHPRSFILGVLGSCSLLLLQSVSPAYWHHLDLARNFHFISRALLTPYCTQSTLCVRADNDIREYFVSRPTWCIQLTAEDCAWCISQLLTWVWARRICFYFILFLFFCDLTSYSECYLGCVFVVFLCFYLSVFSVYHVLRVRFQ